jgi:long-chain acyl-CoA synthetase
MGVYDITIQDVVRKNATFLTDEVALVCGNERWTFSQYAQEVDRLASGFTSLGVEKRDRIGVVASNCHEYLLLYGAAARLGAIVLPINSRLKSDEVQVILEDCTPKVLVASPEYAEMVKGLADRCMFVAHSLVMGEKRVNNLRPIREIAGLASNFKEVEVTQQDPFVIIYTAAVEGRPRGVVLTHGNLVTSSLQAIALMGIKAGAVYLNLTPLFHVGGLVISNYVMHAGGRNVILKKFDAQEALYWIRNEQVTIVLTYPPMTSMLLDQSEASGQKLSSLQVVLGIENPETIQRLQQLTEAKFWVGYGQTETTAWCTLCPYSERPDSSGKETPLARISLIDEYDREVPLGQPGEIVVRGPLVFQKYWNLDKDTSHVFREGWHHTGDIGLIDEKGYLWYQKRKSEKELIKPGGENVYPAEVEKALLKHPDVLETCVFGVPDKQWGEAIKAVCVCKPNSNLKPQELIEFVASRIARYKKPKYIVFVDALPKTKDGMIDREKVKTEHSF